MIGGLGSVAGAMSGVFFFRILDFLLAKQFSGEVVTILRYSLSGAGLLWILYFLPGGLWQFVQRQRDRFLRRVAARRHLLVPSLVADKRVDETDATNPRTRPTSSRGRCHERDALPVRAGPRRLVRTGADPLRPRPGDPRGRDRRPPRHQRRRQVHAVQVHHRAAAPDGGIRHLQRPGAPRPPHRRDRGARRRDDAGRPERVPDPHRARQPAAGVLAQAQGPRRGARVGGAGARPVPAPR